MQKSWRWFFIGRLAIMLAFTPEVRAVEVTAQQVRRWPWAADSRCSLVDADSPMRKRWDAAPSVRRIFL